MSELQAILERRRRRADATRDDDGELGGGGGDGAAVPVTTKKSMQLQPQQQQQQERPFHQFSQYYVGNNANGEGGRVDVRPTSKGRVALRLDEFVPTPPSQLPSRINSSNNHADDGNITRGGSHERAKIQSDESLAYTKPSPSLISSSTTPQDELQKKLLERRMKFCNDRGADETKSDHSSARVDGSTVSASRVGMKWNGNSIANNYHTADEIVVKKEMEKVKIRIDRAKRDKYNNSNNPAISNATPIIPSTISPPISQSQPTISSTSRTGGFFKRTSPPTNSTTRPTYGTANVISNRQPPPPPPPSQQPQQHTQLQPQPQIIGGRPSSSALYSNSQQSDIVRRTVAGRVGGGSNRRGAPQSPPVSILSSMAAKYKEEIQEQVKEEEEEEEDVVERKVQGQNPMELMTQRYKERTDDSTHREEQHEATTVKFAVEVQQESQLKNPSTPPRKSNNVVPSKVLPANTSSDDGNDSVPEFMRMKLRSTPNKRRSAMGVANNVSSSLNNDDGSGDGDTGDAVEVFDGKKESATAAPSKSSNSSHQKPTHEKQPHQQQSLVSASFNAQGKTWPQEPSKTKTTSSNLSTPETKIALSSSGKWKQPQSQLFLEDRPPSLGMTRQAADNHQQFQLPQQQQQQPEDGRESECQSITVENVQQHDDNRFLQSIPNVYNTAVLAAKNAIDMSNRSRARPWRIDDANSRFPKQSFETSESIASEAGSVTSDRGRVAEALDTVEGGWLDHHHHSTVESVDARDPSLTMEPSPDPTPSSSLVMVDEEAEEELKHVVDSTVEIPPPVEDREAPQVTERCVGGDKNRKGNRLSQLANLLATDEYEDVPTTPSAVLSIGKSFQPNAAMSNPSTGKDPPVADSEDGGGMHVDGSKDGNSFFGTFFVDSEDANHNSRPPQLSPATTQNDETSRHVTYMIGDNGLDNPFSTDPFASTADFDIVAVSENNDNIFSQTNSRNNDRTQPTPPSGSNALTDAPQAENSHTYQQSNSYDKSVKGGSSIDEDNNNRECVVSFDKENDDGSTGEEEFIVDVPNLTDGTIGSSVEEDIVIPTKQPLLTTLHDPPIGQRQQMVGTKRREISVTASFHVKALDLASAKESPCVAGPIKNPLSGNLILCRHHRRRPGGGEFVIEEVDVNYRQSCSSSSSSSSASLLVLGNISTDEIQVKLKRSYSTGNDASGGEEGIKVLGVSSILSLAAGVHRVKGQARVRVAVLADIFVISSGINKINYRGGVGNKIRIVAVWRWGYNSSGVTIASLQSVLTMDSIDTEDSRCGYDPTTLQVADGLLFLGGHLVGRDTDSIEPTFTAAVFIAKPSVRNFWISVPLRNTNAVNTQTLSATNDANPYLAAGLSDGSVHVLTYDMAARTNRLNIHKQNASLLHTLHYLNGELDLKILSDEDCLWAAQDCFISIADRRGSEVYPSSIDITQNCDEVEEGGGRGSCISLAWMQHDSSGISSLPLLAVAFSSGIAIYLVESPSNLTAQMTPTVITPLAQSKFFTSHDEHAIDIVTQATNALIPKPRMKICWFDLGPRLPPCLSLLFEHEKHSYQSGSMKLLSRLPSARLCLLAIDIPWYGSVDMGSSVEGTTFRPRPIGVIAQKELNAGNGAAVSIVSSTTMGVILCYPAGSMLACEPTATVSRTVNESYFSSLLRPVASAALGLDSDGSVYLGSAKSAATQDFSDVVLSVFSVATCDKNKHPTAKRAWSMPSLRHWLMISSPGEASHLVDDNLALGDDSVNGGAFTDVLFELTCGENPTAGLVPSCIVKEDCGRHAAVMFSSGFFWGNDFTGDGSNKSNRVRTQTNISTNAVAYTILDIDNGLQNRGSTSFQLRHGRDVAFLHPSLTNDGFYCSSLVVLEVDGSALSLTTMICSSASSDSINERILESVEKCSLQYEGIEGYRVFTLLNGDHPEILVAGYCHVAELHCLILTNHSCERSSSFSQPMLVEVSGMGQRLWLRHGESILSAHELPRHMKAARANIAMATQERVMIVSPDDSLVILAEIDVHLTCTSLSSLGSHCVAFCATSGSSLKGRSQVMYLSCLEDTGRYGSIANIPTSHQGMGPTLLAAVRPDRCIYLTSHSGLRIVDKDDDEHTFIAPLPCTRPLLLLEPLIANALCQDGTRGTNSASDSEVQRSLRTIIGKFGRKDMAFPHGDTQGIGTNGAGITSQVYKMLTRYKCIQAASILLTGNVPSESHSLSKMLPPWVPIQSKLSAVAQADIIMQGLLCRDTQEVNCAFPSPLDASSILAEELAFHVLEHGSILEAAKLLDFAGRKFSEFLLSQLALSLETNPSTNKPSAESMKLVEWLDKSPGIITDSINKCAKLCSGVGLQLVHDRHSAHLVEKESSNIPVSQLAPSVQSVCEIERVRNVNLRNDVIDLVPLNCGHSNDSAWVQSLSTDRHIWSTGPLGMQEKLLELNEFEDWLGRCCPAVLDKEGVEIAAATGERTLADILSAAARDKEECGTVAHSEEVSRNSRQKSWVEGVGEGRRDEDNLSLYIRFSEGADEDANWKTDGFTDLTKYTNATRLYGYDLAAVEATTSSVDEGEEGKVRLLYDLVYHEGAPRETPTGLVVEAPRGGSLDLGMLHSAQHPARKRCTIELWYHLPQAHVMTDEIILVRRSLFYEENDDASKLCLPDEKHNILWELAVLPTGSLELRTGAGSAVTSAKYADEVDDCVDGFVSWEREHGGGGWNHLCLVMSSLSYSNATEFSATILMNGSVVVPGVTLSVNPFGTDPGHDLNQAVIDESMERTVLIFAIGPSVGFRMTDVRVWACQRSEDDVKMMMYEYLRDAEMKKKLKVNIRKGAKKSTENIPHIRLRHPESRKGFALAPPQRSPAQETVPNMVDLADFVPDFASFPGSLSEEPFPNGADGENNSLTSFRTAEVGASHSSPVSHVKVEERTVKKSVLTERSAVAPLEVTFSDLLSTHVRKSAAAAIVRGPPAARHFGGNRGGLLSEHVNYGCKCDGVSPIAICGVDKSVVWFSDRDPPGKTYPIGASGAVLSDVMDDDQSEYMCCFLAKEKRMVVFELSRKSVLVELQMKTKLNFWRYLPPEAHGCELVFVLITPIGGFHWKPLDKMPRPCQVWKRGPELESKKILTYEEGGSNGLTGANARSSVALVTVSSATSESTSVEAYCIAMYSGSTLLRVSNAILGAALYRPTVSATSPYHFLPYVIIISQDVTSQLVLDIESLAEESGTLVRGNIVASTVMDVAGVDVDEMYEPPSLSMGHTPEVLCCCHNGFIVAIIRRKGLVFVYDFSSEEITIVGKNQLRNYVVDAAIRSRNDDNDSAELVLLLADGEDPKDGRVATIQIARLDDPSSV